MAAMTVAGCAGGAAGATPRTGSYAPRGKIEQATTEAWQWIRNHSSLPGGCGVQDNRWNEAHAAAGTHSQRVFVEDLDGTPAFGWHWRWPTSFDVATYPEVVCGTKPWDLGGGAWPLGGALPFQPTTHALEVSYDLASESVGTHNQVFSLWAVNDPGAPLASLAAEIMVWIDDVGMTPAGSKQGTVQSGGTTFDVYVDPAQRDNSGGTTATWVYAAFLARSPRLAGPLDFTPLLDWLRDHDLPGSTGQRILPDGAWIGSVELGTEIVGGAGVVEITGFDYQVIPR